MNTKRKNSHQYKLMDPKLEYLRKLGARLVDDNRKIFKKSYRNLLGIMNTKFDVGDILTLVQFYDPSLVYFTLQEF